MLSIGVCNKCVSPDLRRSRIRSLPGWLFSFILVPYRCRVCDHRQLKFRFVTPAHEAAQEQERAAELAMGRDIGEKAQRSHE